MTEVKFTKKAGKGLTEGRVSELAAFFGVIPGRADELDAAVKRFAKVMRDLDPSRAMKTGLRDSRHVIFDDGKRLLWATTFETDWDPYLDDALLIVGVHHFIDWMQHTTEADTILAWFHEFGGKEGFDPKGPEFEKNALAASQKLKGIIQSVQTPASSYFNPLGPVMMPEIIKATTVAKAFEAVLNDPKAEEALAHPALKPLLNLASS